MPSVHAAGLVWLRRRDGQYGDAQLRNNVVLAGMCLWAEPLDCMAETLSMLLHHKRCRRGHLGMLRFAMTCCTYLTHQQVAPAGCMHIQGGIMAHLNTSTHTDSRLVAIYNSASTTLHACSQAAAEGSSQAADGGRGTAACVAGRPAAVPAAHPLQHHSATAG